LSVNNHPFSVVLPCHRFGFVTVPTSRVEDARDLQTAKRPRNLICHVLVVSCGHRFLAGRCVGLGLAAVARTVYVRVTCSFLNCPPGIMCLTHMSIDVEAVGETFPAQIALLASTGAGHMVASRFFECDCLAL
jgi:hypothetical protein